MDPVARVRHRGRGSWDDRGGGGGTAHRRVCWGRPNPSLRDSWPAPSRDQYGPAQVLGKSLLDRSDAGRPRGMWPLAIRPPPHPHPPSLAPLAEPERGRQSKIHDWQGAGANLSRMWNSSGNKYKSSEIFGIPKIVPKFVSEFRKLFPMEILSARSDLRGAMLSRAIQNVQNVHSMTGYYKNITVSSSFQPTGRGPGSYKHNKLETASQSRGAGNGFGRPS